MIRQYLAGLLAVIVLGFQPFALTKDAMLLHNEEDEMRGYYEEEVNNEHSDEKEGIGEESNSSETDHPDGTADDPELTEETEDTKENQNPEHTDEADDPLGEDTGTADEVDTSDHEGDGDDETPDEADPKDEETDEDEQEDTTDSAESEPTEEGSKNAPSDPLNDETAEPGDGDDIPENPEEEPQRSEDDPPIDFGGYTGLSSGFSFALNNNNKYKILGCPVIAYTLDNTFGNHSTGVIETAMGEARAKWGNNFWIYESSELPSGWTSVAVVGHITYSNTYDISGDDEFNGHLEAANAEAVVLYDADNSHYILSWTLYIFEPFFTGKSVAQQKGIIYHEVGHMCGLADNSYGERMISNSDERDDPNHVNDPDYVFPVSAEELLGIRFAIGLYPEPHECTPQPRCPKVGVDNGVSNEDEVKYYHSTICSICNREIYDHVPHSYATNNESLKTHLDNVDWSYTEDTHSTECDACGHVFEGEHEYENGICRVCGYPDHEHEIPYEYVSSNQHAGTCSVCGLSFQTSHRLEYRCATSADICVTGTGSDVSHFFHIGQCRDCNAVLECGIHHFDSVSPTSQGNEPESSSSGDGFIDLPEPQTGTPFPGEPDGLNGDIPTGEGELTQPVQPAENPRTLSDTCAICDAHVVPAGSQHQITCTTINGEDIYTCICGETLTVSTSCLHHYVRDDDNTNSQTHRAVCSECGNTQIGPHDFSAWRKSSNTQHKKTCLICSWEITGYHTADAEDMYPVDDTHHGAECTICNEEYLCAHAWSGWIPWTYEIVINGVGEELNGVQNPEGLNAMPDGGEGGTGIQTRSQSVYVHKRTCTVCLYESMEEHDYPSFTSNGPLNHTGICSVCNLEMTVDHYLICITTSDSYHHAACRDCSYEADQAHDLSNWSPDGSGGHFRQCTTCDYQITGAHTVNSYMSQGANGHTASCPVCGFVITEGHTMPGGWTSDGNAQHIKQCTANGCTYRITEVHTGSWTSDNDLTHERTCPDCGEHSVYDHVWSAGVSQNNTQHKKTCSECQREKTENHSMAGWVNNGTSGHSNSCDACNYVSSGAHVSNSYTSSGSSGHTATCLACSASFSESHAYPSDWTSISNSKHAKTCTAAGCGYQKTANHSFGAWTSDNDSTHQHTCTVCDKTVTASHTWGAGTSLNNSKHTKTCTVCSRSKTENHSMAGWTSTGNTGHSNACVACNYVSTGSHSASSYTSTNASYHTGTCTVCSAGFTASHGYPSSWSHNSTKHYKTCTANGCGYQVKADHSFGEWYNNNGAHTHECTVCGRTATGSHSWSSWTSISSTQHERTCGCGASQTGSHSYGDWVNHSEAQHKHSCTSCGRTVYANHSFGSWTSTGASQHKHTCSACSKVVTVNHDHWTYQYYSATQHKKRCTTCTSAWYFEAHTPQYTGGIYICSKCGTTLEYK